MERERAIRAAHFVCAQLFRHNFTVCMLLQTCPSSRRRHRHLSAFVAVHAYASRAFFADPHVFVDWVFKCMEFCLKLNRVMHADTNMSSHHLSSTLLHARIFRYSRRRRHDVQVWNKIRTRRSHMTPFLVSEKSDDALEWLLSIVTKNPFYARASASVVFLYFNFAETHTRTVKQLHRNGLRASSSVRV